MKCCSRNSSNPKTDWAKWLSSQSTPLRNSNLRPQPGPSLANRRSRFSSRLWFRGPTSHKPPKMRSSTTSAVQSNFSNSHLWFHRPCKLKGRTKNMEKPSIKPRAGTIKSRSPAQSISAYYLKTKILFSKEGIRRRWYERRMTWSSLSLPTSTLVV